MTQEVFIVPHTLSSHSHLSPASAAVPPLHTAGWSQPGIFPQRTLCRPEQDGKITIRSTFPSVRVKKRVFCFSSFLPAGRTACPADSAVGCGLPSLRCAPAQSAPGCRPPCASALPCHQQCGFGKVPGPCPCSTQKTSLLHQFSWSGFFSHCVRRDL